MFEAVGTLLGSINIFGVGIYLVIVGMMFSIARGITRDKEDMVLYFIIIGSFGTILLFSEDYIKTFIFLTVGLAIIIYGLNYLRGRKDR